MKQACSLCSQHLGWMIRFCPRRSSVGRGQSFEPEGEPEAASREASPEATPYESPRSSAAVSEVERDSDEPDQFTVVPSPGQRLANRVYVISVGEVPSIDDLLTGEIRWYAVWSLPADTTHQLSGLHWGLGTHAYGGLLSLNGNEFRGIRFRRFDDRHRAERGFAAEAGQFGLDPRRSNLAFKWWLTDVNQVGPSRVPLSLN